MHHAKITILAICLTSFASLAHASIWAKRGTSFPAKCFSDSLKACRSRRIPAPDKQKFVQVGYEKVVLSDGDFVMSATLDVVTNDGKRYGIGARGLTDQEVVWSSDSNSLLINGSDGGEGPEYVSVYRVGEPDSRPLKVIAAQRDMMQSFPPCKATGADPNLCASFAEHPEEINVSAIDWNEDASAVVVMAEMPCSSAYGGIWCQVKGYEIEVSSGKVLRTMGAREFARRWQHSMAFKFHIPDPPRYGPQAKSTPD